MVAQIVSCIKCYVVVYDWNTRGSGQEFVSGMLCVGAEELPIVVSGGYCN